MIFRLALEQNKNKTAPARLKEGVMMRQLIGDVVEIAALGTFLLMVAMLAHG
jgi:hypothetical protein